MPERVSPQVFLIGSTQIDFPGLEDYLGALGVPEWNSTDAAQGEKLIEVASRSCYMSFGTDLNDNITRTREGNKAHLGNILSSGHGSVLEHASSTWAFHNVSRVFTHELVRHRAGCAISQESLRFVRADNVKYRGVDTRDQGNELTFDWMLNHAVGGAASDAQLRYITLLKEAARIEGLEPTVEAFNTLPFSKKKKYTSAARRVLPIGMATTIVWTANMRALRHVIAMRTSEGSEEEIRGVFMEVARVAKDRWPNIFQDMSVDDDEVIFGYPKV